MKIAFAFVVLSVMFVVGYAALTCRFDENKCDADECCLKTGPYIRCEKLTGHEKSCEMKPMTHLLQKHMHLVKCPCASEMKCIAKDGMIGKVMGTCQLKDSKEDSKEEEGEE